MIASARALRRSGSAPVNKGVGQAGARIPQIDNPLLLGALGLAAVGAGAALAVLRPSRRGGRTARFRSLALGALAGAPSGPSGRMELADLQVQEGFGKPTLVSFDVLVDGLGDGGEAGRDRAQGTTSALVNEPDAEPPADSTPPAQVAADIGPLLLDAFDRLVQAIWDNPEIAPVAIRGRLLSPSGTRPLADMTSLGFDGEIARPADLYEHYGSPASDRGWRP
ncbi:hypothetical protein I6B53_10465 [Schaalia sp. 19OD2882]|nr:hypothetical protein I6B53_10465 [Schaalia sp. 19OD2882]